jgi:arabinose-5-phosphate isomerase
VNGNWDEKELIAKARAVVERETAAVQALAEQLDKQIVPVLRMLGECEGHVLVTGAGTSRAMAERFAHLLSCSGTPALYISAADALHGTAGAITERDVVFIISKGGRSAEVNQFADVAKSRGARIVAQTEDPASPLARMADVVYQVRAVGEVDPFGGLMALGSSLVNGAAGDVLCALLVELNAYDLDEFGRTHPGGAVGEKLAQRDAAEEE